MLPSLAVGDIKSTSASSIEGCAYIITGALVKRVDNRVWLVLHLLNNYTILLA